jgi:arylsulfatase A-like enzyme
MTRRPPVKTRHRSIVTCLTVLALTQASAAQSTAGEIQHDAEHYILLKEHGERWAEEDKLNAERLAEIRDQNGGKPPNILYILIDDVGYGEFGIPELNYVRGYSTPAINKLADESLSLARMYSEPSCTPTRTAFLTGRLPVRSHMLEPKVVPPEGSGLHEAEVTMAEVLSQAGYNTVHVGKWHQGDLEDALPHNQGFDFAAFPMHNQATFGLMHAEAEAEGWANGVSQEAAEAEMAYTLDPGFRPRGWVLGLEAKKGEQAREWAVKAGDPKNYTYEYFRDLNQHFQDVALEKLRELAADDEPFFLNYWGQNPVDFGRLGREFTQANGGAWVESMKQLDTWVGELLDGVDRLGIRDNTLVVLMCDNGTMEQALGFSGFSDMIYRGYKANSTEGGIRVPAFIRWPAAIPANTYAGDIVHVSDLFTTFAVIAGADQYIPRDRIIDGVDQTTLLLNGDTNGRRDYIHMYEGPTYSKTIKQQFKVHWPAPGSPSFKLPVYDLYRDPREEHPLKVQGMWTVAYFGDMKARHMAFKKHFPDRTEAEVQGIPYEGIENLRPETLALRERFLFAQELAR